MTRPGHLTATARLSARNSHPAPSCRSTPLGFSRSLLALDHCPQLSPQVERALLLEQELLLHHTQLPLQPCDHPHSGLLVLAQPLDDSGLDDSAEGLHLGGLFPKICFGRQTADLLLRKRDFSTSVEMTVVRLKWTKGSRNDHQKVERIKQ